MIPTKAPPPLNIPTSQHTVIVHIINTTARLQELVTKEFFQPEIKGFDTLDIPSYSFLIDHPPTGHKVPF